MDEDLLPARMVNEFVYCPRLFCLEWVDGRFADNDDTRVGQQVHRRVDTGTGAAPLPEEGELRTARSVMLSSQRLGVIAKIDVIEGVDGGVAPVDYKKGEPQPDGEPWPSDEVQACTQGIVLRDNGYRCDRAKLYYAAPTRRVSVELGNELGACLREHLGTLGLHSPRPRFARSVAAAACLTLDRKIVCRLRAVR